MLFFISIPAILITDLAHQGCVGFLPKITSVNVAFSQKLHFALCFKSVLIVLQRL